MSDKYRIDPNFVVPEPSAAKFFCYWTLNDYSDEKRCAALDGWRAEGVKQARITIINDEFPHEPYPHGYWLEGWLDEKARLLPFGKAETNDGPIYPPLTYGNGKLASAIEARSDETQSGSAEGESAVGSEANETPKDSRSSTSQEGSD